MAGDLQCGTLTLNRGVCAADNRLARWLISGNAGGMERRDLTLTLFNQAREPVVTWHVKRAWPTKLHVSGLNADGNEVAIEALELAHEGLTIRAG